MTQERKESILGIKRSLVFWIILAILLAPSSYFVVKSFHQLQQILNNINKAPSTRTADQFLPEPTANFDPEIHEIHGKIFLELDSILHRHQRSQAQLASRTWLRFMSMTFGAILIVVGGGFILGRISIPRAEMDMETGSVKISLAASSPGLFLVFFGCILVTAPIVAKQTIWTKEGSSYVASKIVATNTIPSNMPGAKSSLGRIPTKKN